MRFLVYYCSDVQQAYIVPISHSVFSRDCRTALYYVLVLCVFELCVLQFAVSGFVVQALDITELLVGLLVQKYGIQLQQERRCAYV